MKKCPRCKLPQEGIDECEYCGLVFEKAQNIPPQPTTKEKIKISKQPPPLTQSQQPKQVQPFEELAKDSTERSPGIAAVLSVIVPGLGHIYNGRIAVGFILIVVYVILWLITFSAISVEPGLGLFFGLIMLTFIASSAYKAYRLANKINQSIVYARTAYTKKCPFCAELIKEEAIVCRFCGRELEEFAPIEKKRNNEFKKRTLCSDGNCIGVIGPDGLCKECGKPI